MWEDCKKLLLLWITLAIRHRWRWANVCLRSTRWQIAGMSSQNLVLFWRHLYITCLFKTFWLYFFDASNLLTCCWAGFVHDATSVNKSCCWETSPVACLLQSRYLCNAHFSILFGRTWFRVRKPLITPRCKKNRRRFGVGSSNCWQYARFFYQTSESWRFQIEYDDSLAVSWQCIISRDSIIVGWQYLLRFIVFKQEGQESNSIFKTSWVCPNYSY